MMFWGKQKIPKSIFVRRLIYYLQELKFTAIVKISSFELGETSEMISSDDAAQ
ncbi:unnamed protein product, partial [marine sediment metagenome]